MLKIKLTRLGKKKEPRYRIVVNERRDKRDGEYLACVGYYHPAESPKQLKIDLAAYESWLAKGAQPTATVAFLYEIEKSGKGFPAKKPTLSKKAKAKQAAAEEEKAASAEQTQTTASTEAEASAPAEKS